MKWRGMIKAYVEDLRLERGVYVEADDHDDAFRKIRRVLDLIYGSGAWGLKDLVSEHQEPEAVLERVVSWRHYKPVAWDNNPLILYPTGSHQEEQGHGQIMLFAAD
jgi:hypothetical protein